jgi:tetratricopeptide (TPR) repeat protein
MDLNPPLVGRDKELELLYDHLGCALSGHGGLVLISGEVGIGKTRILSRLSETAETAGFFVISGGCVPGIPLPYLPFQEAFAYFSGGPFESDEEDQSKPRDPTSILFDALELLVNESAMRPILICLEDLHWADSSTTQLLLFLARKVQRLKVLMVGTYRPEDLEVCSETDVHPLLSGIRLMNREGTLTEVPLGRIGENDLSKAIEGMLGAPADQEVKNKILEQGGGNPLFIVETVRMLVSENRLELSKGIWMMRDKAKISIPRTIQEVVLRRLEKISKDQRRILECASAIGEAFEPDLIAESTGMDKMLLLEDLDNVTDRLQLVAKTEEAYRFSHAMIRDVIYSSISRPRRKELHRRIGCSIEKGHVDNSTLATLSWHFCQAQDTEKTLRYSVMAGENFMKESSYIEAISQFVRAFEIIPDDPSHLPEKMKVLEGLGDAYREQCISSTSMNYYEKFLGTCSVPKDRARVLCKTAANWNPTNLGRGDATRALELLDMAEACDGIGQEDIADIEFQRATVFIYDDDIEKASESLQKAMDYFASTENEPKMMESMKYACFIKLRELQFEDALEEATIFLEKAYDSNNRAYQIEAEWAMGHVLQQTDRPEQALLHLAKCEELAARSGDLDALLNSYIIESEVEEGLEDFPSARDHAEKALKYSIILDDVLALSFSYTRLGRCSLGCGDIESTETYLTVGWTYVQQLTGLVGEWFEGLWSWSKGKLEVAKGHHDEGFKYFELGSVKLERAGTRHWDWAALCHLEYATALIEKGMRSEAKEHLERADDLGLRIGRSSLREKVRETIMVNRL